MCEMVESCSIGMTKLRIYQEAWWRALLLYLLYGRVYMMVISKESEYAYNSVEYAVQGGSQSYNDNLMIHMHVWHLSLGRAVVITNGIVEVWMLWLWKLNDDD